MEKSAAPPFLNLSNKMLDFVHIQYAVYRQIKLRSGQHFWLFRNIEIQGGDL